MLWKKQSKIRTKQIIILLSLLIVSIIPIVFQKDGVVSKRDAHRTLTIITAHNETIRSEFEREFASWWSENYGGEQIYINWVTPGGSAEVRKVIDTKVESYRKNKGTDGVENVGIDVFFGGGVYEFEIAKRNGYLAKLDVFKNQNYLFAKGPKIGAPIPQQLLGEQLYDADKEWVGVCLSSFGICYNLDTLKSLGIEKPPTTWDDLADPRYFKKIALADPTKSGSVTKAFEMILQQKMQNHLRENPIPEPGETKEQHRERILNEGWRIGLRLIQRISANARYFSDSASKIPHDVASGDAAAGMCIDFYGRTYNSKLMDEYGYSRIKFVIPDGGTAVSADPVAVFKNAAEPNAAQEFVRFCLHERGQLLWNTRVDPDLVKGPHKTALRRLPIRKDLYTEDYLATYTDPDDSPYQSGDFLVYDSSLTGKLFNAIQVIIRVMSIDTHEELAEAWKTLVDNDLADGKNEIQNNHFHDLGAVSYTKALNDIAPNISKMKAKITLTNRLADLEKHQFSMERMNHHYPDVESTEYDKLAEKLKKDVDSLKSFDLMYLEIRQQELAKRFRASYSKVVKNAAKKAEL